jgi:hypothetical protein
MLSEDFIEVLYNSRRGVYEESDKAIEIYNFRKKQIDPLFNSDECYIGRSDPILVQIYREMGDDFNKGKYSKIKIKRIPKKYENYYCIREYDGLEYVNIDDDRYNEDCKKNRIKEILKCSMTDSEKINELNKICLIDK